jgi:NADH-quinone oxidoreductase subunit A
VAKSHIDIRSGLNAAGRKTLRNLSARIDRAAAKPYYSNLTMTDSGLHTYAPLLLHLLIAFGLAGGLTAVSVLVGWRRPSRAKQQAYECGMEPTGDAREPFSVKFYLVAMVFILFDVEAIFLYPWAYIFRSLRWYGFVEMMIYIAVLLVGYLYLWKKGALDWNK